MSPSFSAPTADTTSRPASPVRAARYPLRGTGGGAGEDVENQVSSPVPEIPPPERTHPGLRTLVALIVMIALAATLLVALPIREAIRSIEGSSPENREAGPGHRTAPRSAPAPDP